MSKAPDTPFAVRRWDAAERRDDLLAMIHASFAGLDPPSGVLNETGTDIAARQRDGIVLIAQSGDAFMGGMFCARKDDALYLTRMATHPDWRRRGVGRMLMVAAENEARSLGAKRLTLRVRVTLPDNHRYFESLGFAVNGRGQDPGRTPYLTMERVLPT